MPPSCPCINHDYCDGYTNSVTGLCLACAKREQYFKRHPLSSCLIAALGWPLYLLWRLHERRVRRKIVRRDGGEGQDNERE